MWVRASHHTTILDAYALCSELKDVFRVAGACAVQWQCIVIDWLTKRHRNTYVHSHGGADMIDMR